ncbi:MAG: hypothetical protein IK000_02890 [Bacteroidaceae bacterium]|nr:hypothetical protein [Bacteroidaceae bacterium]
MRRLCLIGTLLLCVLSLRGQTAREAVIDSLTQNVVNHLLPAGNQLLTPLPYYDCIHYEKASLRFPAGRAAQDRFNAKLDSLLLFGSRSVSMWHVGGSHVQADFFSHRMRTNFTRMQPDVMSTRGLLFPYDMAKTNWNHNYHLTYTGTWQAQRNIERAATASMGAAGIAAVLSDTLATLTLVLNVGQTPSWTMDRLRVLGYASSPEVALYAVVGSDSVAGLRGDTVWARVDDASRSRVMELPANTDSVTVTFCVPQGETFTLTGLIPESDEAGIRYFSSGINGAAVPSWLRCSNLPRDLQLIRPDIVFFAIGVNDAAVPYGKFDVEAFKSGYRRLMQMVQAVSPDCAFVFITNNDTYRRESRRVKRANRNGELVQQAMLELARESGGAVWDVFAFMGGLDSSPRWRDAGLMSADLIHFTRTGYELLGNMLYNALIDDYLSH